MRFGFALCYFSHEKEGHLELPFFLQRKVYLNPFKDLAKAKCSLEVLFCDLVGSENKWRRDVILFTHQVFFFPFSEFAEKKIHMYIFVDLNIILDAIVINLIFWVLFLYQILKNLTSFCFHFRTILLEHLNHLVRLTSNSMMRIHARR